MSRKIKYNKELKLEVVKKYLKGESATLFANEHNISRCHGRRLRNQMISFNKHIL